MSRPQRPSAETIAKWQSRRFGLFIHWGLYSIPGGVWKGKQVSGYNEQIRAHARIPKEEYAQLAGEFNPVLWNPDAVAALAKEAGMTFVVLTSKHHDGFSLFHTSHSQFNVVDATPYGKDIVAGLAEACRKVGLGFGVYFSTIDWNFEGGTGIDYEPTEGVRNDNDIPDAHAQFNAAQLTELLSNYGPISEVWFDMGKPTLEQSMLFADTVHCIQPETMVSGRVFNYQGDFTVMGDNEIPRYPIEEPWQSPASIFHETWGYRSLQPREDLQGKIDEHVKNLTHVVSRGGNYLLNIGPRGDGSIVEFEADVLRGIGKWLTENSIPIAEPERNQIHPNSDGELVLTAGSAERLFHYNGFGYSDPPKLYKLRWWVCPAKSGKYLLTASFAAAALEVEFQITAGDQSFRFVVAPKTATSIDLGAINLESCEPIEISITPPAPFEKGTPLSAVPEEIILSPT